MASSFVSFQDIPKPIFSDRDRNALDSFIYSFGQRYLIKGKSYYLNGLSS